MKEKKTMGVNAMGGSSLLTAFAVLCLTSFALLSLSTVQAEKRLSDTASHAVSAYYEADLEAERVFARLRAGEDINGISEKEGTFSYSCRISPYQALHVEVARTENGWEVLRWQSVARCEETDETLPVWNGR